MCLVLNDNTMMISGFGKQPKWTVVNFFFPSSQEDDHLFKAQKMCFCGSLDLFPLMSTVLQK